MAYHIYQTEAFVLDERPIGESNKLFFLLTPDLGMVAASAQGIRLLKSKLRFHLFKYGHAKVSLVRGKESWRLIGAEKTTLYQDIFHHREKYQALARVFLLLRRFIRGESSQPAIFNELKKAMDFLDMLSTQENTSVINSWELIIVARLLSELGYIKQLPEISLSLSSPVWSEDMLSEANGQNRRLLEVINGAISASHF